MRHHKQETKYNWSTTASDKSNTLHWAAFFSDIEHEVLPVSEGYRVTLTYNLSYHSKTSDSTDVKKYDFYKALQTALSNPVFMHDGGVLGFNSHYSYVFDTQWADILIGINTIEDKTVIVQQLNKTVPCEKFIHFSKDEQVKMLRDAGFDDVSCKQILDSLPSDFPMLKGADYIVAESAKSLGLPVCVKPFLGDGHWNRDCKIKYALKDFSQSFLESDFEVLQGCINYDTYMEIFGKALCRYNEQDITWCQELLCHQPAAAAIHYGNESTVMVWYKSAAILIRIPKWSDYRQKLIISTGEYCIPETSETDEDGMVKDFRDIIYDNNEDIMQEEEEEET